MYFGKHACCSIDFKMSHMSLYFRNNPFHNYEHACHVTMSVSKLLKRIVAPELTQKQLVELKGKEDIASHLYDYTHGINSDPLATLAVKISALIHDVDHRGCSNAQLMVEEPKMAQKYSNQSIAEQNSLDLAWDALMKDKFNNLRACLFNTEAELMRFRQLIVNGMFPATNVPKSGMSVGLLLSQFLISSLFVVVVVQWSLLPTFLIRN